MLRRPLGALWLLLMAATSSVASGANAPAIFVFGDSTADVGNNNYLPGSSARADFPHNGVDLPGGEPTGRFSNGLIGVDFLGEQDTLYNVSSYAAALSDQCTTFSRIHGFQQEPIAIPLPRRRQQQQQ